MPNIIDAAQGTASLSGVAVCALLDVALVIVLVALTVIASRLLEKLAVSLIALVAGSGSAMLIESYLTYPGVVYHELSHALFALVTGARVTKISLKRRPAPDGQGYILGSVQYIPRGGRVLQSFQLLLTGLAPSITGLAGMAAIATFAFPRCSATWHWVIWIYLFVCLLLHSGLSRQDLKGVWAGAPIVVLILFVVFLLFPFDAVGLAQGAAAGIQQLLAGILPAAADVSAGTAAPPTTP